MSMNCATCDNLFLKGTVLINGVEGPRCGACHDKIVADVDKDCGPAEIAAIVGVCVGSYIRHGVTKKEALEITGDIYDSIVDCAR